jgi:two-component system, NtrC family, sensor kinase
MTQEQQASANSICSNPLPGNHCHLLEGSSIPTFVIDHHHRIRFWNRACECVTGTAAQDMIGTDRHWAPFYPTQRPTMADLILDGASPDDVSRHYGDFWRQSTIIPGAYESEGFFPTMGSDGIWLFFTASPLFADDGTTIGAIETLQDISGRKRAEEELRLHKENLEETVRQRTEELTRAHAELAAKAATLLETNEELSQYAFVVSHDLRAPLRAVRNYADFLREELEDVLTDEQRSYFDGMTSALRFGDELVNDLLDFSRVGGDGVSTHAVSLDEFLTDLKNELELPPDAELICSDGLPIVLAERTLLRQILCNLVTNGLKFNHSSCKRVEIGLSAQHDTFCELYVRDNGIGIAPRYHDRIFKMFKRLHTHKEFKGTGIGLAIVKKAVVKLGGSVRVESEIGCGSTFLLTFPTAERKKL